MLVQNAFECICVCVCVCCIMHRMHGSVLYLLLLNLAPCDISIDSGVGPFRRVSGGNPNILSLAVCPYFKYCFCNPIIKIENILSKFDLLLLWCQSGWLCSMFL